MWALILATLVVAMILILPVASAFAAVAKDGSTDTGVMSSPTGSSISFSHTTGTGTNRLLLVGVSWNCGTTDRSISSVTFTPSGGSAVSLTAKITQLGYNSSNPRYSAIYYLVNPPSGTTGTVTVTFAAALTNGAIAGAANFAGVDQTTPLGTAAGAGSSTQDSTATVTLSGLSGNELVFDNVFMGVSATGTTMTPDASQSQLWSVSGYTSSATAFNVFEGASAKQASGSSVTMTWTISATSRWCIAAVPIRPAGSTSTFNLNLLTGWNLIAANTGSTFPSSLFGWTGSAYQSATNPVAWNGYWCKAGSASGVTVTPATGPKTIHLTTGWNLIGNSMQTTATLTVPSGRSVFVYDTSSKAYVSVLTLAPGQGAWIHGTSGETVTLTGS